MSTQYSFCRADMINPEILCIPGRDWYEDSATVLRACLAVQRAHPGAYWLLSKYPSDATMVYAFVEESGKVAPLAVSEYPHLLTEESIEDEWDHLNAPLRELMARFQTTNKEDDMSESKSKYDNATMAEQLRAWADSLAKLGAYGSQVPGIIAGMRQVADDLAPKKVFDRRVKLTRAWRPDWELVRDHLRPGLGPLEAWTDQVRAEVEGALTGAMLAWESYSIDGEAGEEKLNIIARLRFEYDPNDVDDTDEGDADFLQTLLYDQGGCAGSFAFIKED